jgi:hypothetical protein
MYLEEMNEEIKSRILEKGFCNKSQDVPKKKLLSAFTELWGS